MLSSLFKRISMVELLGLTLAFSGCQSAPATGSSQSAILLEKDFKSDLPSGKTWPPAKFKHLEIKVGEQAVQDLAFDLETVEDEKGGLYLKTLKVSQPQSGSSDGNTVNLGNPVNRGTKDKILMSVPLTFSWTSSSATKKQSFTKLFNISADGTVTQQ